MGQFTMHSAIRGVFLVASITQLNKWLERVDTRLLLSGCFFIQVVGTALMSTFTSVWQWYVAGAIMGFFMPPVFLMMQPIILSNWFVKKRGMVTGIALAFSGIGGAIMNPILASIIQNYGWRTAYVANAIIAGVIVMPFLMFVVRLRPSDKGLKPYGYEEQTEEKTVTDSSVTATNSTQVRGVSREEATRSLSFAIMMVTYAACGFFAGYPHHITAYAISIGHPATLASFLVSLSMIGNVISKLSLGFVNDKFGGKVMMHTAFGINLVSLLLLLTGAASFPALLAGALLAGCFLSISSVATPLLIHTVYGSRDYTRIFVLLSLSQNIFVSFGSPIIGYMFDYSGGYALPFTVGIAVTGVAAALAILSIKTSKKLTWK